MFYLMLVPVTLILLWELRYLAKLRQHDRVLFPICETRGEVVRVIASRDAAETLNADDYVYARWMLGMLDNIVSLYRDHRARFFDLRAYLRFVRDYKASARDLKDLPRTENADLRQLEMRLNLSMLRGFLSYTPWLKSELLGRLAIAILSLLAKTGIAFFARRVRDLRETMAVMRTQRRLITA